MSCSENTAGVRNKCDEAHDRDSEQFGWIVAKWRIGSGRKAETMRARKQGTFTFASRCRLFHSFHSRISLSRPRPRPRESRRDHSPPRSPPLRFAPFHFVPSRGPAELARRTRKKDVALPAPCFSFTQLSRSQRAPIGVRLYVFNSLAAPSPMGLERYLKCRPTCR